MRRFSLSVIFSFMMVLGLFSWGPLSRPAIAQSGATVAPAVSAGEARGDESRLPGSAPAKESGRPVALNADSLIYNATDDSYEASGEVILQQGGVELRADSLLWQAATQDADAQGDVHLNDTGTEVSGARVQYNLATGQGLVRDGRVLVREGNFHLTGDQVEKRGQAEYFVRQGTFTTCDGEVPDWKFSASEVDVTLGGYARARHVWFHISDVPVLYTPYLMFPVKTERESGFLTPVFGYSNNKGTRASLAWYQVIDRHLDATVYLDHLSEIGLGKGMEYRYALASQNNGEAVYYHVNGFNETPDLYYLKWRHGGLLPGGWRLAVDVEYTDDALFFEEFGDTAEDYNRDKTVSTLTLSRHWRKLNLVGYARYTSDLETDNDKTLQRLPEAGVSLASYRLGDTPFYAGLESYATRFRRDEGDEGERLYLKPSLAAVFTPGAWLEIVPQIAFYQRLYDVDGKDDEMFVPEFSLGLATRRVRNFDIARWGIDRLQHSVEPRIVYTYVPDESQDDLPLFDLFDRIERRNEVRYALVNRFTARSTAADGSRGYREVLNLRLSQGYDIDEAGDSRSGSGRPFSDVQLEMAFRPTRRISLDIDSLIPVYGNFRLHTLTAGASARDDSGNGVSINYTYRDEGFAGVGTDYLGVQIDTVALRPVYVRLEERYDLEQGRELEKVLGLEYRAKCWSLLLTYRNRYRENDEDEQAIMLTFILAGLGQGAGFGKSFAF